ncbi:MAG: bifunctional 2-polyprenyl-6-hydroxyphenol methylase/3-demethylubiquinol 3-O-methyltransferase UbiG, partial [Pseudomonadota bacterium]
LKWFEKHCDFEGKKVLDLGCAGGFMAEALEAKAAIVTGIDPAAEAIEAAKAHAAFMEKDIRYDVGVGEQLPYESGHFDAVVCVDVLEHVSDLQKVMRETARVLKPGGVFLFDTINRNMLASFAVVTMAENVLRLLPKGTHDPALFIKPNELKLAATDAGLDIEAVTGLGPAGISRHGDILFGRLPFKFIIYMGIARKLEAPS